MRHLIFVCNALDDATRIERGIITDSPAASRKVLMMAQALAATDVQVLVLSMGRGRQNGSGRYFGTKSITVQSVAVRYLPFLHFPVLSELLTMLALALAIGSMRHLPGQKTVLFYNRMPAYWGALLLSRLLGFSAMVDIEDGETDRSGLLANWMRSAFDRFCTQGALLACRALASSTSIRPVQCCYGVMEPVKTVPRSLDGKLKILLGGTVSSDTGATRVLEVLQRLRDERPDWASRMIFHVTGKGDALELFLPYASTDGVPSVVVHGRMTDAAYQLLLQDMHVGLALKPVTGVLANTTFPSKVVEFAAFGMLVVTTDISDVREMLGDHGACYLVTDEAEELQALLRQIVEAPASAMQKAERGQQAVLEKCDPRTVGAALAAFLFESVGDSQS